MNKTGAQSPGFIHGEVQPCAAGGKGDLCSIQLRRGKEGGYAGVGKKVAGDCRVKKAAPAARGVRQGPGNRWSGPATVMFQTLSDTLRSGDRSGPPAVALRVSARRTRYTPLCPCRFAVFGASRPGHPRDSCPSLLPLDPDHPFQKPSRQRVTDSFGPMFHYAQ